MASLFSWRRRLATETAAAESVAMPNWQGTTPKFLRVRLPTRQVRGGEVGGRVEIELPNGAGVRLTGDAERMLRDEIAAAGALPAEASSC